MEKIVDKYFVVRSNELVELVRDVNGLIVVGYECQGGIAYDNSGYLQAMIKYRK